MHLSVLTERRVFHPYGAKGGLPAKRGENRLKVAKSNQKWRLPSRASVKVDTGDEFELLSPGGGGYGSV